MSGVKGRSGGTRKGAGRKAPATRVSMSFAITKANAAILSKQPNKSAFVNDLISGDFALELAKETQRRALLESLLAKAIRHKYLIDDCPKGWLAEAIKATAR